MDYSNFMIFPVVGNIKYYLQDAYQGGEHLKACHAMQIVVLDLIPLKCYVDLYLDTH